MPITPFVVGQWVRGDQFYGRRELIQEILHGNRNCLWLLGTRRVGKTSLLKQLEHLTQQATVRRWFPVFWDLQGSESEADLHENFRDALIDATDRLVEVGISFDQVDADDLLTSIAQLRREIKARGLSLLLLADEAEQLVVLREKDPRFLLRLRRTLQSPENIRSVFASTIRLWELASVDGTTSPFLHGFTPPLPVRSLGHEDARELVRQSQLTRAARPRWDDATVASICERCNNHPYLLQLLGERVLELGDLEAAAEAVAGDQMVSFFFASDLAMLNDVERRILALLELQERGAGRGASSGTLEAIATALAAPAGELQSDLQRLEHLGFIHQPTAGVHEIANPFFRRWLAERPATQGEAARAASSDPTIRTASEAKSANGTRRRVDDRYELVARLGRGASGDVYKAHDTLLRTVVAVKMLKPEYGIDDEALERLRREVVLARDLSHPNLLKIYHLGEDRGQPYITMQFVDGPDLAHELAGGVPFPVGRAVPVARKLASGLAALHRCQVLHRDIKPSNVLIDEFGEPRITDFGLARLKTAPGVTQTGIFVGTPAYASPEQALGEDLDERSDLYALGLVLFEMVTGRPAFVAESIREYLALRLRADPPAPRDLSPDLPQELSDLIVRCLARERSQRYGSAAELEQALVGLGLD